MSRYQRQMLLPKIGSHGQERLMGSRVLIVGCGAIGSVVAEQLARAGVGTIRIADRDIVEMSNLQRQVLFDESDALDATPKAVAAARQLARVNSTIKIEPLIMDIDSDNIERMCDVDLIIDGTDNVETRYLINDVSVKRSLPWIYGACVGSEGRVMAIRPPATACLRCIFPRPAEPGELPTCDTAGVLAPAAAIVGAMQAAAAIKLLSGTIDAVVAELVTFDLWDGRFRSVSTEDAKRADCPTCGRRTFEFLERSSRDQTTRLCGRSAVQFKPPATLQGFSLDSMAGKLGAIGTVRKTPHLIRASLDGGVELTIFADGRVLVHGVSDVARARSIHARFIGT
jgi:adenylyltransferase/sulfurtransferase